MCETNALAGGRQRGQEQWRAVARDLGIHCPLHYSLRRPIENVAGDSQVPPAGLLRNGGPAEIARRVERSDEAAPDARSAGRCVKKNPTTEVVEGLMSLTPVGTAGFEPATPCTPWRTAPILALVGVQTNRGDRTQTTSALSLRESRVPLPHWNGAHAVAAGERGVRTARGARAPCSFLGRGALR
jgi:hypothetical protein